MFNTQKIARAFHFPSAALSIRECKAGHINSTFFVECEGGRYVVQRINKRIFNKPHEMMQNVILITNHIRSRVLAAGKDATDCTLEFVRCNDGYVYTDDCGECWRAYRFVNGISYSTCTSPALFEQAGIAFGEFQNLLADCDASALCEVIPDFHNTVSRYRSLEDAFTADVAGRAAGCMAEMQFIRARKSTLGLITEGLANGSLPLRITHNDTKLNNVIFDAESGKPLCVIDLDTVMPGSLLYDFGDAIRFGASTAAEDESDLSLVSLNLEMVEAFTGGFVGSLRESITDGELKALPEAARIMTLEQAIRFLTDYLQGDIYFRTAYDTHNLTRARNQLRLAAAFEGARPQLDAIISRLL